MSGFKICFGDVHVWNILLFSYAHCDLKYLNTFPMKNQVSGFSVSSLIP
ncbi:hypothetical protein MtrunA17_Chr3g0113451 [Medicago truncatula]|uniref:Uncharacterized protein n=1 Tax=Medicago truncatula TaxID=3880 RepID=A0A396IZK1_MEDTR|nr:hypothetical protein MtrunA17_Chr3g0113451 [Medicago truncatula]